MSGSRYTTHYLIRKKYHSESTHFWHSFNTILYRFSSTHLDLSNDDEVTYDISLTHEPRLITLFKASLKASAL